MNPGRRTGWSPGAARSAGVLGLAAVLASGCGCAQDAPPAALAPHEAQRADRHVSALLGDCAENGFYDRDLADITAVLLAKLEHGKPDALKRAKTELGLLGERAFPALANLFHENYSNLMRSPFLENAVDSLAFNSSEESHRLLLEALQHPQETVRAKALDGLARFARPEDFDVLAGRLAIETRELRRQSVAALFTADRTRAEDLFLGFLERGEEKDLGVLAAPYLAASVLPDTGRRCAVLLERADSLLAAHLAAAAAHMGHEEGSARLVAELASDQSPLRMSAVSAVQRAGLLDLLGGAVREDPSVEVRAIATAALGAGDELPEEQRAWLGAALNDGSAVVRAAALKALCSHGDSEGLARALSQLEGEPDVLQSALLALREPMRRDPELARTALDRLLQRHALEEHRPIAQRSASFKGIAQVPLAAAAEFLHRTGVEAGEERIEGLRAHDWLMIQAANTGVEGRSYLAEALAQESDPLRRLDLIDAIGSIRDDLARATLLDLVEGGARSPWERLLAASALIKVGPSWDVAPRLKRVCFAMNAPEERDARTALQCLLWQWY